MGATAADGDTSVSFFLSTDRQPGAGDLALGIVDVAGLHLERGRSHTVRADLTVPRSAELVVGKAYYVVATVNGAESIAERSVANNGAAVWAPFTLLPDTGNVEPSGAQHRDA